MTPSRLTPAWKARIGDAMRGRRLTEEHKQKIGAANHRALRGRRLSALAYLRHPRGSSHWWWKANREDASYSRIFLAKIRHEIRRRARYRCQQCNVAQSTLRRQLNVHHIDQNKRNDAAQNLIALCASCHKRVHHRLQAEARHVVALS